MDLVALADGLLSRLLAVGLQRPGRDPVSFRFSHAWDSLQEEK